MQSINEIKPYMDNDWSGDFPVNITNDEIVMGWDEWDKKFVKVKYRRDSNCFFTFPYTGAVYPKLRMHKFKKIES